MSLIQKVYIDSKVLENIPEEYKKDLKLFNYFVLGFFETYGNIKFGNVLNIQVECIIRAFDKKNIIKDIRELYKIKPTSFNQNTGVITFLNVNAMDFLHEIYSKSDARFRDNSMYKKYLELMTYNDESIIPFCNFIKSNEHAVIPYKHRASDIGYDLTIIKKVKDISAKTTMYDTFIRVQPCFGYYTKIVPRSSLSKSGYMLANSIGIIDPSYTASLKIVLTKIDDSLPDLKLPFTCCQLIIDKAIHFEMEQVFESEFIETDRAGGGFGSTTTLSNKFS